VKAHLAPGMGMGHGKVHSINEYRDQAKLEGEGGTIPLVIFTRKGLRLKECSIENKIGYIGFDTFADIQRETSKITIEDQEKTGCSWATSEIQAKGQYLEKGFK